jgi:preprotein translocase subunit SecG
MPIEVKWAISLGVAAGLIWVGWRYTPVLVTLHVLVCFLLVIVIMLQSGSAADLAGAFGGAGSQTAFGPRGAATFLSKATTWCAIVFMATSLTLSLKRAPSTAAEINSILEQTTKTAPSPQKQQNVPIQIPAPQTPPAQTTPPAQQAPAPQNPAPQNLPPKK